MTADLATPLAIAEFAKDNGYDNVKYLGIWQGYKVFEPTFTEKEIHYTGYPLSILLKYNEIRFTTEKETFEVLDFFAKKV